jgi:hypothetical protein
MGTAPSPFRVTLTDPRISGAEGYHAACQRVLEEVAAGRLAAVDAAPLLKVAKAVYEAARLVERTRC